MSSSLLLYAYALGPTRRYYTHGVAAMLDEPRDDEELPRIPLPRTRMNRGAEGLTLWVDYERPGCGYAAVASACHAKVSERNRSSSLLPTLLMRLCSSRGSFLRS